MEFGNCEHFYFELEPSGLVHFSIPPSRGVKLNEKIRLQIVVGNGKIVNRVHLAWS